jgi:hypothetical protein
MGYGRASRGRGVGSPGSAPDERVAGSSEYDNSSDNFPNGETTNGERANCAANERQVETFSGTGDQTTPQFEINGTEWRFSTTATPTSDTSGEANVTAQDEGGPTVGTSVSLVNPEVNPTDNTSSAILDGPGAFTLKIVASGVEYNILVCESTAGGGGSQKGGGSTNPEPSPQPPPPLRPLPDSATRSSTCSAAASAAGAAVQRRRSQSGTGSANAGRWLPQGVPAEARWGLLPAGELIRLKEILASR